MPDVCIFSEKGTGPGVAEENVTGHSPSSISFPLLVYPAGTHPVACEDINIPYRLAWKLSLTYVSTSFKVCGDADTVFSSITRRVSLTGFPFQSLYILNSAGGLGFLYEPLVLWLKTRMTSSWSNPDGILPDAMSLISSLRYDERLLNPIEYIRNTLRLYSVTVLSPGFLPTVPAGFMLSSQPSLHEQNAASAMAVIRALNVRDICEDFICPLF